MHPMAPGSSIVSRDATPSLERSIDCDSTAAMVRFGQLGVLDVGVSTIAYCL